MHPLFLKEGKSAVSVAIGFIAANYTILPCPIPKARRQPVLGKQFKKPSQIVQICFSGDFSTLTIQCLEYGLCSFWQVEFLHRQ